MLIYNSLDPVNIEKVEKMAFLLIFGEPNYLDATYLWPAKNSQKGSYSKSSRS